MFSSKVTLITWIKNGLICRTGLSSGKSTSIDSLQLRIFKRKNEWRKGVNIAGISNYGELRKMVLTNDKFLKSYSTSHISDIFSSFKENNEQLE